MNRKKKPTEEVKMSTWEVFRRLVRDARPIYGWLLLGALLGGIVVACTVIAPKLLGQGIQLLYDAWAGERPKAGLTEALLPICGALAGVYLLKSIVDTGKMVLAPRTLWALDHPLLYSELNRILGEENVAVR